MIGLGSIGKRHIKNLQKVLKSKNIIFQIDALRSIDKELDAEIKDILQHQFHKVEELPDDYDVIFITNPTSLHFDTIHKVIKKTRHMFIEKPVFDKCCYNLDQLSINKNNVYYVACPLRHKMIVKYLKEAVIPKEEIISCRIISTSYLPNWRKGQDYRKIYSAKKDLGGGVTRDLIHEWDYAIDLFGIPQYVDNMKGHFSNLEIDSDDISIYIAKYKNMLLEIHLDYIGQKTERTIQIFTNSKRIDVDLICNELVEYQNNVEISRRKFEDEDFYLNEMEYFINCVNGQEVNINTISDAYETLKIALGEERY